MSNNTCINCIHAVCIGAILIIFPATTYIKYLLSERTKWLAIKDRWILIRGQITIFKGI